MRELSQEDLEARKKIEDEIFGVLSSVKGSAQAIESLLSVLLYMTPKRFAKAIALADDYYVADLLGSAKEMSVLIENVRKSLYKFDDAIS